MKNRFLLLGILGLMILTACGSNDTSKGSFNSSKEPVVSQSSSNKVESSNPNSTQTPTSSSSEVSKPTSTPTPTVSSSSKEDEYVPTPMPNPDKSIYMIGAAVWGWSSYAKLTLMTDNIFYGTFDLKTTTEGFVFTSETSFNGLVFHNSAGSNFTVSKYGTYNVYFTYDESKTDSTWSKATEKTNTAVAYYKIQLESSIEVPIEEDMMFINGPAVEGWGTYIPLFEDDNGVYSYIYGLKANGEGFTITSEEDNEHLVYHKENGGNFTVDKAGDYRIMFTYNDMSSDDTWGLAKEQNNGADGYYKLEPLFKVEEPENPTPTPTPDPDPTPDPEPENPTPTPDPDTLGELYIFGAATGGWENKVTLPEVEEGVYKMELQISASAEGFVICELDVLSDKTGFCLHDENGNNFQVKHSGLYELSITWNDMSKDTAWKVAKEVNSNAKGDAYYKLVPLFEINDNDENPVINEIYVNGGNVGGWGSYVALTKVNDNLFEGVVNLGMSTDGFVLTAQQNRNADGLVFKTPDGVNLNIVSAGNYTISFSTVAQDATWIEVTDAKANYSGSCYVKLEAIVETRTNVILNGKTTAKASTSINDVKTPDKVFDQASEDLKRWESVQGVDPQWIEINLGQVYTINGIDIQWYGASSAKTYIVEVSTNGTEWKTILDITNTNSSRNRLDKHTFASESAQFIRITGTSRNATYGYSIGEISVWGV